MVRIPKNNEKKKIKMESSSHEYNLNPEYVLMPWDDKTTIIVSEGCNGSQIYSRWELIQKLLQTSEISSAENLISTIKSYNIVLNKNGEQIKPNWNCSVLCHYFEQLDALERKQFFKENGVLSTIRKLSLQLKELVPRIKLLKSGFKSSIKLHQIQVASILGNAFFCTFPKGKADCPSINFDTLYEGASSSVLKYYLEKIKCLMHYFKRIHQKQPSGSLSFYRLNIPDHKFPRWDKTNSGLCSLKVDAQGKIEDQVGFVQMDFANKYVGGGVLGRGCVQEEIRFLICPELIAARLFTECLADNESLFVVGAERYCQYTGYSKTFEFAGNYEDPTPFDENRHRKTYLIILDALYFHRSSEQYRESKILRELKKAYVGFKPLEEFKTLPLATGNWGCGAFGGDPQLKSLLQLMASSEAQRDILYLTFGNSLFKGQIEDLYQALKRKAVNVGMLYRIIRLYGRNRENKQTVFEFVLSSISRPEKKVVPVKFASSTSTKDFGSELLFSSEASGMKRQQVKEEIVFGTFPEMDVDFEALDREVQKCSNYSQKASTKSNTTQGFTSSIASNLFDKEKFIEKGADSLDIIWYENEISSKSKGKVMSEEHLDAPVRPSKNLRNSPSLFSDDERFSENSVRVFSQISETRNLFSLRENEPQCKKFVQSKITDCFFKK